MIEITPALIDRLLQLGHAFSRVETERVSVNRAPTLPASIGPRVLTRGNISLHPNETGANCCFNWATRSHAWKRYREPNPVPTKVASIGPRVLTRGNPSCR